MKKLIAIVVTFELSYGGLVSAPINHLTRTNQRLPLAPVVCYTIFIETMRIQLHNIVDGKHQCDTYTVEDLINELQQYPSHMPVVGVWDHCGFPVCRVSIAKRKIFFRDAVIALDVSHSFFKDGDDVYFDY